MEDGRWMFYKNPQSLLTDSFFKQDDICLASLFINYSIKKVSNLVMMTNIKTDFQHHWRVSTLQISRRVNLLYHCDLCSPLKDIRSKATIKNTHAKITAKAHSLIC